MAEPVVSFVIERIGDLLIKKVVFLKRVQGQVERLQNDLVRMRCFLKDADQKQDGDERIRNWVSEIRAAAYDAEDVIEIFASKIECIKKDGGIITKLAYYPRRIVSLYKTGKEIESLQMRLSDIADSREKYGISNLGEGMIGTHGEEFHRLRRSSPIREDRDIVGFEEKTKSLVAELLKEDTNRRVFSVIGMGGVGKTTLARKVYNHDGVRTRFDCRAWVCVSSSYNYMEILRTIIKQVNKITNELLEMLDKMEEQDLEQMLYENLQDKRYLVVLDDIWKEEVWDCLARAFPDVSRSSRLLLTSRNRDVPLHADALSIPYELKTLGPEDSWQLFLKKAFSNGATSGCPLDLEKVGREIARRCAGLPLAITVVGGLLLGKKKLKSEWEKVLNNLGTYLSRGQNGVSAVLELSYAHLPPNLKVCFLYLSLFPEGCEISVCKLIDMWTAEGIIQKRDAENLEESAAYDVEQLISRNMVQVEEITIDERIKSCRIHDLLRDLAIRKAKDENFFQIHDIRNAEISAKSRYLAVQILPQQYKYFGHSTPHLRSLLFFNVHGYYTFVDLSFIIFKKLRVLDLEHVNIDRLPQEIGEARLLKYLGLRDAMIEQLPCSLGRLRNLQTLDIFNYMEVEVPNFIWKLENLRQLYAYDLRCKLPLKIEGLRNLQTLSRIHFDHIIHNNMMTLTSLRKLGIWVDARSNIDKLCMRLSDLGNLQKLHFYKVEESQKLHFYKVEESQFPSLAGLSKLHHVTELKLSGDLKMLPPDFPPNLSRLSLTSTHLMDDPMPILEKLGQLSFLKMKGAYEGRQLTISRNGFRQLKFLELGMLDHLNEIKMEKTALPQLRSLRISDCYSLAMLPEQLNHIPTLDKVELVKMPESFVSRLDGQDSDKIFGAPNLRILDFQRQGRFSINVKRKIRAHADAIRAAYLFKAAGEAAAL